MRRGGVLILLISLILIVGALAMFLVFQPDLLGTGGNAGGDAQITPLPTEEREVEVVQARIDIPASTVLTDTQSFLRIVTVRESEFNPETNFSNFSEIEGQLTTRTIRANQLITRDMLTAPGLSQQLPPAEGDRPRDKAYPLIVNNLSGVADQIKPGDFVDVVATFSVFRRQSYPTGQEVRTVNEVDELFLVRELKDDLVYNVTKTVVQRAQVLRVIPNQPVVTEGQEGEEVPAPTPESSSLPQVDDQGRPLDPATGLPASTITQGAWTLILAINDQEVEIVEFALASDARIVLVLRGAGDTVYEPTIGVTLDLLVSEFGLPLPRSLPPRVLSEEEVFIPEPTLTPAPTRVP